MTGAFVTLLGGWWARLWAGSKAERSRTAAIDAAMPRMVEEIAPTEPEQPVADGGVEDRRVEDEEVCFRETVRAETSGAAAAVAVEPAAVAAVRREQTLAAMRELKQIPALQALVQGFMTAINRPDVTVGEVIAAVENDAALCVRLLGMANSAAVAPAERIEDLNTAVQMIGVLRVRRVAQALFTLRDAQRMTEGLDWRHLWIHAFACAAIAEELERKLRPAADSRVHLAALLHDVGKIVLATVAGETYRGILVERWNGRGGLEEVERERLGVDHREAGVVFAERNRLPEVVIAAIAHHAVPAGAEQFRFEVALVSLANHLTKLYGLGFSGSRLVDEDGEFEDLPAWGIIEVELGYRPDPETLREELNEFIAALRVELRGLREAA